MEKLIFKINKEGWVYIISSGLLTVIFFPFFPIVGIIFLIITCFIINFFRDPDRVVAIEELITSPADGTITFVGESKAPKECKIDSKFLKISIFLSIFNVHVNRIPSYGIIKKIYYISGKFFNATLDKSSEENERNIITIKNNNNDIIILTQVAGLIARRIVCNLKEGQKVSQGERFGIIKFGSRVDIYLPINYKSMVSIGQKVLGGETIISNPNKIFDIKKTTTI